MATAAPTRNIHEILPELRQGSPVLGSITWWDLGGILAGFDTFMASWRDAGLPDQKFTPVTLQEATRRGLEDWLAATYAKHGLARKSSSATSGEESRTLVRVINKPGSEWVVFILVSERADLEALGLSHASSLRVGLHKETGALRVTYTAEGGMDYVACEEALREEMEPYRAHYTGRIVGADMSNGIRFALRKSGGVCVRKDGGVYFMPPSEKDTITQMAAVLGMVGGSLTMLDIPDTAAHKAEMQREVTAGLNAEIAAVKAEILTLNDKSRKKTIQAKLSYLSTLKVKALAMADTLNFESQTLTRGIDELRGLVGAILTDPETEAA